MDSRSLSQEPSTVAAPRFDVFLRLPRSEFIPRIDKGKERFQLMIPILPPPPDVQGEIDLGVGGFFQAHLRILVIPAQAGIQPATAAQIPNFPQDRASRDWPPRST